MPEQALPGPPFCAGGHGNAVRKQVNQAPCVLLGETCQREAFSQKPSKKDAQKKSKPECFETGRGLFTVHGTGVKGVP